MMTMANSVPADTMWERREKLDQPEPRTTPALPLTRTLAGIDEVVNAPRNGEIGMEIPMGRSASGLRQSDCEPSAALGRNQTAGKAGPRDNLMHTLTPRGRGG